MRIDIAEFPTAAGLLDHGHSSDHAMVVLAGSVVEDGTWYGSGTVRISAAGDRHFLRFEAGTRCVVVQAPGIAPPCGLRRVLQRLELAERLARASATGRIAELVDPEEWHALSAESSPPAWLLELEARRSRGKFVHATGTGGLARLAGVGREHLSRS